MKRIVVFLADGFEEIEALAVVDILRRAGVETTTCSISSSKSVTAAHGITVSADTTIPELTGDYDMVFLPGGMPGSENLANSAEVRQFVYDAHQSGKLVAAICAAPIALDASGILSGHKITCYPGFESRIENGTCTGERIQEDGQIITGKGAGVAMEFGLYLVEKLIDKEAADGIKNGMFIITPN